MVVIALSASLSSCATTATRVVVWRSIALKKSGANAMRIAKTARKTVEAWNIFDRMRSTYSRRATITALGNSGSRRLMRPDPRPIRPARSTARGSSRRPPDRPTRSMNTCSSDGSAISKCVTRAPRGQRGREDRLGLDARLDLDLGALDARPQHRAPGTSASHVEPVVAVDRQQHHPPAGRALHVAQRAADDDPAVVDDRDRLAHRLDRLHLVGREDDRLAPVAQLQDRLAQQRRCSPGRGR